MLNILWGVPLTKIKIWVQKQGIIKLWQKVLSGQWLEVH
jgi:hypothetical protein